MSELKDTTVDVPCAEVHGQVPGAPPSQAAGTQHFAMDVDEVPASGQTGWHPCLVHRSGFKRHFVEQLVERAWGAGSRCSCAADGGPADGVPEARRHDVVQVIDVPKIPHCSTPLRRPLSEPQMVEQLVEVPVPASVLVARGTASLASNGASLRVRAGSTGVWDARPTSGENARLGLPPAQGGILMLGKPEAGAQWPLVWTSL